MKTILVILIALFAVCAYGQTSYDGYRLLRLTPETMEQVKLLADLENSVDFDVWNGGHGLRSNVDVALSPAAYEKYKPVFEANNLKYSIIQHNIQNLINEEQRSMSKSAGMARADIVGKFGKYSEIMSYIDVTAAFYDSFVSAREIGKTYENRLLKTLVIKTSPSANRKIWIDCGIHAREWISPATCIYMAEKLIEEHINNDPITKKILDKFEIHIMPLVNPDGYDHTWTSSRLWRKNRTPNVGSSCIGVDLNRNFGFQWMTGGSSNNPCSDIFAGYFPDSELETKAVEAEILKYKGSWDSYLTIHTYGLWWFLPWGYSDETIPDYTDLEDKAKIAAAAIKSVNGLEFEIGSSAQLLYVNSGPSDDWARGVAGINYSYTLELRPGQTGVDSGYGFILPEDRILPAGTETWAGVKAYLNSML